MTLKTLPVLIPTSSSPFLRYPFSWLFLNRRSRILFLTLCAPVLLPILCLSLPLLFLAHLYVCLCRRSRRRSDDCRLRRCEEGDVESEEREMGWMLLQRYLEDQLGLVGSVVSAYDCAGDGDDDDDQQIADLAAGLEEAVSETTRPLLL